MCDYEGIFPTMKGVIFYSNTNQSKAVAEYFMEQTGWKGYDLNAPNQREKAENTAFERAVIVFPVYCQNAPDLITDFLKEFKAKYLAVAVTYGKMCYGRVLYEIQQDYKAGQIVAAAYVPAKHSYLDVGSFDNFEALRGLVEKIRATAPTSVVIEKSYKNPFASAGKDLRSRILVKIKVDNSKCVACGKCERECLYGGIKDGKFNNRCIRCLKCVTNCPTGAIKCFNRALLRVYLKKKPHDELKIYL